MGRIDNFISELGFFSSPLADAAQNKDALNSFCHLFGFDFDDHTLTQLLPAIEDAVNNLSSLFNRSDDLQITDLVSLTSSLLQTIEAITETGVVQSVVNSDDDLVLEVFDFLSLRYLSTRMSLAEAALSALGVITEESVETTDPGGRQVDFVRVEFHWSRLRDFIQNHEKWASRTYGWAGNPNTGDAMRFDFGKAIINAMRVIEAWGLSIPYVREMSNRDERDFFLKSSEDEQVIEGNLPFYQSDSITFDEENNHPVFSNEAGLKLVPFGDLTKPEKLGLALTPYVIGDVRDKQQLSEGVTLDIFVSGLITGGVYLTITPDGIDIAGGEATNAGFNFSITYENPDQSTILLAGDSQSTHFKTNAILGAIGGNMSGDFYLRGGFNNLKAVVDISEDGFLNALLSRSIEVDAGDVIMGWQPGRGVYFEGGTSLGLSVALNRDLGAIFIRQMRIVLNLETDVSVLMMISAQVQLGPIFASPENVGMRLTIAQASSGDGMLGKYDFSFGFKPPDGIGLSVDAEGITGGGFLKADPPNYAGMMELSFQNEIELTAFGLITTKLPDGKDGFSLVIQILAEFQPIQLGLGFALTGVGGLIGINRQLSQEGTKAAFKTHTLDNILFPKSPIKDAVKLIESVQAIMPPRDGYHIFGPMVKLFWGGSRRLVNFEIGVFIQISEAGGLLYIVVIGQAWSHLPTEDAPRLIINVDVLGIIDFGEERVAFDATLFDSRILDITLDGKMALRADWSRGEENFALSVGGFHPRFQQIPPGFPQLRRLALTMGDNPRLTLTMYLAITPNTLQVGAQLDLWAKKLGFTITGGAGFDALFTFSPFSFLVIVNIWVNVRRGWIDLGVWLELELSGPNPIIASGYAKFKIGFFSKKIPVRAKFGKKVPEPLPAVSPLAVLKTELQHPRAIRFRLPAWASANIVFTEAAESKIDPIADVIILQSAVPLNFPLEKFGGGIPPETEKKLSITAGLGTEREEAAQSPFALEQFKNWSTEQRLSAKPFERCDGGICFSGEYVIPEGHQEDREIVFETVLRESQAYLSTLPATDYRKAAVRTACLWPLSIAEAELLNNWSKFGSGSYYQPLRAIRDQSSPNVVKVLEPGLRLSSSTAHNGKFVEAAIAAELTK